MEQSMTTVEVSAAASGAVRPETDSLRRLFRAIIFDWDGTAVVDRREDATPVATFAEALLRRGVWLAVVTGTNFGNIDRQFVQLLAPTARRHLFICANRGSEVYGFDRRGATVRRYLRISMPAEEATLTRIAEVVRDRLVAETGLEVRIVYDRLNRRKIDLIPLPGWADPPKAQIGALLAAVEERLHRAGLAGGLANAIALTRRVAQEQGMPDARITSDVKNIEVGLTDKRDAMNWLRRDLLRPHRIGSSDVLVGGDEFGPIVGFNGSDDLLRAGMDGATIISVGAEPNGVPEGVVALGGGPVGFRALLRQQVELHQEAAAAEGEAHAERSPARRRATRVAASNAFVSTPDSAWRLEAPAYEPTLEHEIESRFAIGNGVLGVRASLEEPTIVSRPRSLVAGLFDTPAGMPATPALVSGPNWLRLRALVDGEPLVLETGTPMLPEARVLDLRRGLLIREWQWRSRAGHAARLRTLRFASQVDCALGIQIVDIIVEQPVATTLEAWTEPTSTDLLPVSTSVALSVWRTAHDDRQLTVAQTANPAVDGHLVQAQADADEHMRWTWIAAPGQSASFVRAVAFVAGGLDSNLDRDLDRDLGSVALAALQQARLAGLAQLLDVHAHAWADRWEASDVTVEGDAAAQRALRFAVYHLVSAANPDNGRVSIGARALTGDGYRGHVFWDTEIFLLPFYTYTWPVAARTLLMYRYHTLPAARAKAARLGYRGALYVWESADTGEEVTPHAVALPTGEVIPVRNGTEEQHISADIAYAVWQYWQATGDSAFLLEADAEIILETARFWASRAALESDGRYHIRGVIGPDEYHEGIDDNAYTNGMARWNLEHGMEAARLLTACWPAHRRALFERLGLTAAELLRWRDVAERLATSQTSAEGVIEQFAGFFALNALDLAAYDPRAAPMDMLFSRERTQRSQVVKQADVVMLLALLWDRYPAAVREANFRYYEPRTAHGSSLSPAIHALVAARLGDMELAYRYFNQAAAIDLDDTMGNAADGVHIAALGGLWQVAVLGFGGLSLRPDGLGLDPHLPEHWRTLTFSVQWRGRTVHVEIQREPRTLRMTVTQGISIMLSVGDLRRRLRRGESWMCGFEASSQQWTEV